MFQCCHGGDTPKGTILSHLSDQMDYCQRSLVEYLNDKRKLFPRFYYISDSMLLAILSSYNNIEEISGYIRCVYIVQYKLYRRHCKLYIVQCTIYTAYAQVHCILYNVYNIHLHNKYNKVVILILGRCL